MSMEEYVAWVTGNWVVEAIQSPVIGCRMNGSDCHYTLIFLNGEQTSFCVI